MPLVKLFVKQSLTKKLPPLSVVQSRLCEIWGTAPSTTKVILLRCEDWTTTGGGSGSGDEDSSFPEEDIYVDIRAYGKSERTREFVLNGMTRVQQAFFTDHNLTANVRLETYDGERYFHVPPPPPPLPLPK